MALVLAVKEGESFYVQERKFTVEQIFNPTRVRVLDHGAALKTVFVLSGSSAQEIAANVVVFLGHRSSVSAAHLCFEAPRSIKILRGELRDNGKKV